MKLALQRPLLVFDLESTGIDPAIDKIVEISVLRIDPDGERESRTRRIDPERPIPAEATAIHGIRDDDVRGCPTFRQIARGLLEFLGEGDLAGFNVRRFDVPLLDREFRDCRMSLGLERRRILDAMTIFHKKEPRDLTAAVRFYLGREHDGAHAAENDVAATAEILEAQLARYEDLPETVDELAEWCHPTPPDALDREGKFVWKDGEAVFSFGKHQGRPLREVAARAPDYLKWILRSEFPPDARLLVEQALQGEFPDPPGRASGPAQST